MQDIAGVGIAELEINPISDVGGAYVVSTYGENAIVVGAILQFDYSGFVFEVERFFLLDDELLPCYSVCRVENFGACQ